MRMDSLLYLILPVLALNCVLCVNSVDLDSNNEEQAISKVTDSELKVHSDNLNGSSTLEIIEKKKSYQTIENIGFILARTSPVSNETLRNSSSASTGRLRRSSAGNTKDPKRENKRGVSVVSSSPIRDSRRRRGPRKLMKPGTRPRPASVRSKLEEENIYDYEDGDNNGTDYDYDYDNDESVYGDHHLKEEIYYYIDELVLMLNESALDEFRTMKERITLLEDRLKQSDAHTLALETFVRITVSPKLGDLRLAVEGEAGHRIKEGYLQFYTGSAWGFVCDDFFDDTAAELACKQLLFLGKGAKVQSAPADANSTNDKSWMLRFNTVLDDVRCTGGEKTLLSCLHSNVGEHDCHLTESVYLSC